MSAPAILKGKVYGSGCVTRSRWRTGRLHGFMQQRGGDGTAYAL